MGSQRERETYCNEAENDDSQLQEFLEVMQPWVKSKLWPNDRSIAPVANKTGKTTVKHSLTNKGNKNELFSLHVEDNEIENELWNELDAHKSENLAQSDVMSDMDYFKSRMKKDWSDSDNEEGPENPNGEVLDEGNPLTNLKEENDDVLKTGCLFVRNLPYTTTYTSFSFNACSLLNCVHIYNVLSFMYGCNKLFRIGINRKIGLN